MPWFREAAKQLLKDYTDPEEAMARALAKVTGHTKLQVYFVSHSCTIQAVCLSIN